MSNVFFPAVDGLGKQIPLVVDAPIPHFSTQVQRSIGGPEFRVSRWVQPRWTWKASLPVLPDSSNSDSYRTIIAFFMDRQGQADSFLWSPPGDAATISGALAGNGGHVTGAQIGVGDGAQTIFLLARPYGGGAYPYGKKAELVPWVDTRNFTPVCKVNGTPVTISAVVTDGATGGKCFQLASAPVAGAIVTADFEMAYRVRFGSDALDIKSWCRQLYKGGKIEFEQVFE